MSADDLSPERVRLKRRLIVLALAAVLGIALGFGFYAWQARRISEARIQSATAGQPAVGGPFQLVDQDGRGVDERILKGKWTAVFFGYTYCPDVCPATLQNLQAAAQALGPDADKVQVLFVSIDPERDTPQALKSYVSSFQFPGGIRALTGTPEQVRATAKAWRAFYQKRGEGPDYLMDHFTSIYLMDPSGRFSRLIRTGLNPQQTAGEIKAAMAEGPNRA